jgi:nitroreductase
MDLFNAIQARRSVRKFRPDPVPRSDLEKLVAAGIEAPSGANAQLRQYVIVDDPAVMDALRQASGAIDGAPAAIVVLIEPAETPYGPFWVQDASAAIENMLLAAVAMGYASCWVEGQVRRHEPALREALGVPQALRVWAILPIGKPAAHPARPAKSRLPDVTHYNRFGARQERPTG